MPDHVAVLSLASVMALAAWMPTSEPDTELRVGESARFETYDLRLTFVDVRRDSRCPVDVTCIRAGEGVVVLRASVGGEEPVELVFAVPPGGGDERVIEDLRVRIVALSPEAHSERKLESKDYVVTVRVERIEVAWRKQ